MLSELVDRLERWPVCLYISVSSSAACSASILIAEANDSFFDGSIDILKFILYYIIQSMII